MHHHLPIDSQDLQRFCDAHGIARLALFGSRIKGTARPDSDYDLLVRFRPGREPGLIGLAAMEIELGRLMGGVVVDLRSLGDLSPAFRETVAGEAEVQYAGG